MPCTICNFPIVDNHHLVRRSQWGDNDFSIDLCPNCHRIYHIIESDSRERIEALVSDIGPRESLAQRVSTIDKLVQNALQFNAFFSEMTALERILEYARICRTLIKDDTE